MNEAIRCITNKGKEKNLIRMNGKMMTLTFCRLQTAYMKKIGQFFLGILFKQRHISSVKSYKYLNMLVSEV